MAMIKVSAKVNGGCKRGSRHMKGRKGCWRPSKVSMGKRK